MTDYREQILSLAQNKPLLPNDVAKALNTNLLMASAMLSELSANKKLKISKLKVGSSPLYFLPDKEAQLESFIASLQEKDRRTAEALRNNKIMQDSIQDPLTRVSLRQITDFSKPVQVKFSDKEELFWKWFLVQDDEAEQLIKNLLEPKKETIQEQKNPEKTIIEKPEFKKETKKIIKETFDSRINIFFTKNNIKIVEKTQVKKATESAYIVEIPSPVGTLTYYCKTKSKKKITESDISNAFVQGQLKKLPVLLLTDGELNKQAKELLDKLKGVLFQKI